MPIIRSLLKRAEDVARKRLGDDLVDSGRRVGSDIWQRTPESMRRVVERYASDVFDSNDRDADASHGPRQSAKPDLSSPAAKPDNGCVTRSDDVAETLDAALEHEANEAVSEHRPDDASVVIYMTDEVLETAERLRGLLRPHEVYVRLVNLASHPHMARQLAQETQVFVPPYVYIRGRYWGAENELSALQESGELAKVLAGDLDGLSEGARRIGRIRGTFSADLTVDNILDRLRRGHILTIDDLDCWYEEDSGSSRFYYQGGVRAVDDMPAVAEEIARAAAADEIECQWHLEPEVHIG